jgi:hypothetical protein
MTDQPASTAPLAAGLPLVQGRCPACGTSGLFLGAGGYITCSRLECPDPGAATALLCGGATTETADTRAIPCPACSRADQAGLAPAELHPACIDEGHGT